MAEQTIKQAHTHEFSPLSPSPPPSPIIDRAGRVWRGIWVRVLLPGGAKVPRPAPPPYTACSLKLVLDRRSLIVSRGTHSVPANGTRVIRGTQAERSSRALKLRLVSRAGLFIWGQKGERTVVGMASRRLERARPSVASAREREGERWLTRLEGRGIAGTGSPCSFPSYPAPDPRTGVPRPSYRRRRDECHEECGNMHTDISTGTTILPKPSQGRPLRLAPRCDDDRRR